MKAKNKLMQFWRNVLHEHGMGRRDKVHLWPWGTNRILCSTFVLDTHYLIYRTMTMSMSLFFIGVERKESM